MQRIVTFKISEDLLRALDEYARSNSMSRSEVIREAIVMLLKSRGVDLEKYRGSKGGLPRGLVIEVPV